jgi:hypothetical protein
MGQARMTGREARAQPEKITNFQDFPRISKGILMGYFSALMKYNLIERSQLIIQLDSDLKDKFKDQCSSNGIQVPVYKTKVIRFNPLKRDVDYPDPLYPTTSTAVVLGVTFRDNCAFSPNATNLVRKGKYEL